MFEADPVERVIQFDIDTEVVRIELQFISRLNAAIFVHRERQRRDRWVN